ncbi:hypothetical protein L1887_29166 [Cichorium endivia]|nr:hypothetical protein L1887_29166 [Cichorium endivia]
MNKTCFSEDVTIGVDGTGLTAIVTGATSGIGLETAHVLALRGVHVVMPLDAIRKQFASQYRSKGRPLNILILNAGIMTPPFSLSKDNIELQFATNHVGNFLLTNLLLDTMKKTAKESGKEGRIVILSSEIHRMTYKEGIRFDKINDENSYCAFSAYGQSKLANALHVKELTRRFQEEGMNITANCLHPGVIATNLARHGGFNAVFYGIFNRFLKNIPQGAATTCYVALHPQVKGISGQYFADSNLSKASNYAQDSELAKKLRDFSLRLTNSK